MNVFFKLINFFRVSSYQKPSKVKTYYRDNGVILYQMPAFRLVNGISDILKNTLFNKDINWIWRKYERGDDSFIAVSRNNYDFVISEIMTSSVEENYGLDFTLIGVRLF